MRRFKISARTNFNVRAEAFNVFNQTTFLFDPAGATTSLPVVVSGINQAVFNAPSFGVNDRSLTARRSKKINEFSVHRALGDDTWRASNFNLCANQTDG